MNILSECDLNLHKSAHKGTIEPKKAKWLKSVRLEGRKLHINGDPSMAYQLPLCNQWNVKDLSKDIERACVEHDVLFTTQRARLLALAIAKSIITETFDGGFGMDFESERLPYWYYNSRF